MASNGQTQVILSIPTTAAPQFAQLWKDLRLAEGLDPNMDLQKPIEVENFDGATMVQWVVDLIPVIGPIFTAAIGYLVAARGEIEYEGNGEKIKFKNLKPSQMREFLKMIDERNSAKPHDTKS